MLNGEVTDQEWDDNENVADSDNEEENVLPENVPPPEDEPMPGNESSPVDPELKADLECLRRIESAISSEKKSSSAIPLPFLVRVENMLAGE